MARPGAIKITVKNRQDSAQEKDYLFFTRVGEFAMYSKIFTRSLHANQFRISGGISYPQRSGYSQPQRRDEVPSQNPRSSHSAAINGQDY